MAKRGSPEWRKKISDSLKKQAEEEDSVEFSVEEEEEIEEEEVEDTEDIEEDNMEEEKEEEKTPPTPKEKSKPKVIIDEVKQL